MTWTPLTHESQLRVGTLVRTSWNGSVFVVYKIEAPARDPETGIARARYFERRLSGVSEPCDGTFASNYGRATVNHSYEVANPLCPKEFTP